MAQWQDGTYDKVMQRVDYERNLGRLNGISDIQAYTQIGNMMADEGKLQRTGTPLKQTPTSIVQPLKAKSSSDISRGSKRFPTAGVFDVLTGLAARFLCFLSISSVEGFALRG